MRGTQEFTVLDWLGSVVAGFTALALVMFSIAGRTFRAMLEDVGSRTELPLLTRLATSAWFPILLAVLVAATISIGIGFLRAAPIGTRRAWVVAGFILGTVAFGLCLIGVYLPVFGMAAAVKAD